MSDYIVSARKYRPQNFESVVGQSALTATLKNAIANNRLAHAYLFCGPRGVGKTSCARIFAKAINCLNPKANGEPCEECESCKAFNEQRSFNIHELDAASNNSVDDIRTLVDQVRIPPQIGKYSVYIVDEVHMLSSAAFNAFLKTLEEPPAHAIFILATTEKHKIIPTILSRCQIYDFNRISVSDAIAHLQYVAKQEGVEADEMALNVIAQKADGAMRDALSIFDQVVSFCGNKVTYEGVIENLNVLDYEYYFRLVESLYNGEVTKALLIFDEILNKGFDAQFFVGGFASHLRDLLVSRDAETVKLLEVSEALALRYRQQAQIAPQEWFYAAIELANECDLNYRAARNRRLLVEVMMIRIAGLKNGNGLKKAEPELPLINAVAPTPVVSNESNNATANSGAPDTSQQVSQAPPQQSTDAPQNVTRTVSTSTPTVAQSSVVTVARKRPAVVSLSGVVGGSAKSEQKTVAAPARISLEGVQDTVVEQRRINLDEAVRMWCDYADGIEKEAYVTNAMNNFPPTALDGEVITVKLLSEVQMDTLQPHKYRVEQYFAQKTGIGYRINFVIDATMMKNEFFSDEDKFKNLQEKNPEFKLFKDLFKLELV